MMYRDEFEEDGYNTFTDTEEEENGEPEEGPPHEGSDAEFEDE